MKKSLIAVTCFTLLLTACKEKPPVIIFHAPASVDTTYVLPAANIPVADPHHVLVEEYTGQSCTNCPAAHETLKELQNEHSGRIDIICLYITGPAQTKPPKGYKYDLRHDEATSIANSIYGGVSLLPLAGIDRAKVSGTIKLEKPLWADNINTRLAVADSINIRVGSSYNPADSVVSIADTIIYIKPISYAHNLSIVILEDKLIDIQEYPSTDPVHPGKDDEYEFTNVFRGMVTSAPVGDPMLTTVPVKEAGRVVVRNYKYKVKNVVNPANCRVMTFISSSVPGDAHILQSAQVKMK